jgi:hypothetical protein
MEFIDSFAYPLNLNPTLLSMKLQGCLDLVLSNLHLLQGLARIGQQQHVKQLFLWHRESSQKMPTKIHYG